MLETIKATARLQAMNSRLTESLSGLLFKSAVFDPTSFIILSEMAEKTSGTSIIACLKKIRTHLDLLSSICVPALVSLHGDECKCTVNVYSQFSRESSTLRYPLGPAWMIVEPN